MTQSPLLKIPVEILHNILTYVIEDSSDKGILVERSHGVPVNAAHPFCGFTCKQGEIDRLMYVTRTYVELYPRESCNGPIVTQYKGFVWLAVLMRTCKALCAEAGEFLYGKSVLQFLSLEDLQDFLTVIHPSSVPRIHRIRISLPLWPPVLQEHIPPGHGDAPDVEVALLHLRTIMPRLTGLKKVTLVTYVPNDFSDDDLDVEEDLIEEHRLMVDITRDAIRNDDGRDLKLTHKIVFAGHSNDMDSEVEDDS